MRPVFYGFMESSGVLPLGAAQQHRQLGGGQSGQGLHGHSGRGSGQILHRGRSQNSRGHRAAAIAAGVAGIAAAAIVAGVLTVAGVLAVAGVHTVIFVVIVVVVIILVGLVVRLRILAGQGTVAGAVLAVAGVGVVALIKARGPWVWLLPGWSLLGLSAKTPVLAAEVSIPAAIKAQINRRMLWFFFMIGSSPCIADTWPSGRAFRLFGGACSLPVVIEYHRPVTKQENQDKGPADPGQKSRSPPKRLKMSC